MISASLFSTLGQQLLLVATTVSSAGDAYHTAQQEQLALQDSNLPRYSQTQVAEADIACMEEFKAMPAVLSEADENGMHDKPLCIETLSQGTDIDQSPFIEYVRKYHFVHDSALDEHSRHADICYSKGLSYGFTFSTLDLMVDSAYCINTDSWSKYEDFTNLPDLSKNDKEGGS